MSEDNTEREKGVCCYNVNEMRNKRRVVWRRMHELEILFVVGILKFDSTNQMAAKDFKYLLLISYFIHTSSAFALIIVFTLEKNLDCNASFYSGFCSVTCLNVTGLNRFYTNVSSNYWMI